MNIGQIAKQAERFATNNSPAILTAIGVVGSLTTAYFTGKASFKARDIIAAKQLQINLNVVPRYDLTKKDKVNLVWKEYIPAAGTAVITIAAIVGANRIEAGRASAMAAAYSLSQKAMADYKEKVVDKIGEAREKTVRDEVAQDRVDANPVGSREIVFTGVGEALCYDVLSDRYFHSTMETIKRAQNDVDYQILHEGTASLADFYTCLGLNTTPLSYNIGWSTEDRIELEITTVLAKDTQQPCISVGFAKMPKPNFDRFR